MEDGPDSDQWRQYTSALCILFVALFIGVPIWWKTTEVYRCPLPYTEISDLTQQQVPPRLSLDVSVVVLGEEDSQLPSFIGQLQQELGKERVSSGNTAVEVQFVVRALELGIETQAKLIEALATKPLEEFSSLANGILPTPSVGHYTIILVTGGEEGTFVSQYRHTLIHTSTDLSLALPKVAEVVRSVYGSTHLLEGTLKSATGKQQDRVDIESMRQLRASQGYQISLTLINPEPSQVETEWNIEEATQKLLLPVLQHPGIASLGNYTINSQVFFYTDTKFHPQREKGRLGYYVTSSQLPPMISSVESKLGSLVSQLPSLNFIVYVPKKTEYPLLIRDKDNRETNAFFVPQWGGVVIYNPPEMAVDKGNNMTQDSGHPLPVSVRMEDIMPVFIRQLKMLLGVPDNEPAMVGFKFASGRLGITDWEVDQLLTAKLVESVSMATTSLLSLVQLLDKVKNMVISDHIQKEVVSSLHSIQKCYGLASEGSLEEAYGEAKTAMLAAETAFFDPSILELLYFPDDQKFAIYIPLFLPISIPIILSSVAALKWFLKALRQRTAAKDKIE